MTTSKWEQLEEGSKTQDEDIDGRPIESSPDSQHDSSNHALQFLDQMKSELLSEERRAALRDVELKVIKYQDDLEAGRRSRHRDQTLQEQVEGN